ncbi:hypothetical protein BKA70DRAFT_1538144 [Coprinopsis sp. MPI-PUGE-AT-0042]|nr:hypothetical protein BKA70DRAFT_1538144 [Coprinopsis sp. MPI-PUGE-AT-0042]
MLSVKHIFFAIASAAWLTNAGPAPAMDSDPYAAATAACNMIAENPDLSPAWPGTLQYDNDVSHWSNASSLPSMCSAKPESPQDIQKLFEIIKSTRTPWAVKGKGHSNVNNMSATLGLQIAMSEFSQIEVSADKKSVRLGTGLDWSQVYSALAPYDITVVGGRLSSVGVAGLLLSSGYSWVTNEYGFAVDNIISAGKSFGFIFRALKTHGSDIFYALQGGVNNFGIVTSFTVKAHPIGKVWGGTLTYPIEQLDALINATAEYSTNGSLDVSKAIMVYQLSATNGTLTCGTILFYDGPTPPPGHFDAFLNIPGVAGEVKTLDTFWNFADSVKPPADTGHRGTWYSAPIMTWTRELLVSVAELAKEYSIKAAQQSKSIRAFTNEFDPFGPRAYSFDRGSAWPHGPSNAFNTFTCLLQWSDAGDDQLAFDLAVEYHDKVWEKAIELGVSRPEGEAFYPPNYSQDVTPPSRIYGPNLPWLKEVKARVDPDNIIALTGGFKI